MVCLPARPLPTQNDIKLVYKKIEEGADVNFVFGERRHACMAARRKAALCACMEERWPPRACSLAYSPPCQQHCWSQ